jgi:hypothetical protein
VVVGLEKCLTCKLELSLTHDPYHRDPVVVLTFLGYAEHRVAVHSPSVCK